MKKTWTLKLRASDMEMFDQIKSGAKSIETRAATIKYRPIEKGDTLVFSCGSKRLSRVILAKHHFSGVDALVAKMPFKKIMPSAESVDAMKKIYASYPGYEEKIKTNGIFAFEIKSA